MRAGQAPGFLTVQGLSLRVAVEGRGQPLLLISGLGASLDVWEPLREILPGFQTIAFDIPGVGESPFPARPLTIPRLARLTAGVIETLYLPPGNYAFACWQTGTPSGGENGPTHASIGMVVQFKVTP